MSLAGLSDSAQNFLKVIWAQQEWSEDPVTTSLLAERTGLRASSVSDAVRKLTEAGLVDHPPYGSVSLTDEGRTYALAMVRRHRLIETFLVEVLHYGWDEVHDEAEVLEHAVSDLMVERMADVLDHPTRDPHGDPIPGPDGAVHRPNAVRLGVLPTGARGRIERISDEDPARLQFFADSGLVLDAEVDVVDGGAHVCARDAVVPLDREAAHAIWVSMR